MSEPMEFSLSSFEHKLCAVDQLGKVLVVMGGDNPEREVSLLSGKAVMNALQEKGVNAVAFDPSEQPLTAILDAGVDRVFIALHGIGYEDGKLQALLDLANIPYTGAGMLGSAIAMNKILSKRIWLQAGVPTAPFYTVASEVELPDLASKVQFPLCMKPADQGSSLGVSRVTSKESLAQAFVDAAQWGGEVIVEPWIEGRELSVVLVNNQVCPISEIEYHGDFYDFHAKYIDDATTVVCPANISDGMAKKMQQIGAKATRLLHARSLVRVDFILDKQNQPWVVELNTLPGLTSHSIVPTTFAQMGLPFADFILFMARGATTC